MEVAVSTLLVCALRRDGILVLVEAKGETEAPSPLLAEAPSPLLRKHLRNLEGRTVWTVFQQCLQKKQQKVRHEGLVAVTAGGETLVGLALGAPSAGARAQSKGHTQRYSTVN